MSAEVSTKKYSHVNLIAKIAILGAIAVIIMLFEVAIPFFPPFYKLGLDEVIVMIGGFALGWLPATIIEALKVILNLLLNGTMTGGIGELANFIMGCSFVVPAAYIYQHKKTMKNAIIGMCIGTLSLVVIGALVNYFIVLPLYAGVFGWPIETIIEMGTKLNASVTDLKTFVLLMNCPFNLIKGVLSSLIVFISYKKISPLLK